MNFCILFANSINIWNFVEKIACYINVLLHFPLVSPNQVNGSLTYFDKIPDGFYLIHGVDPYAWTLSTDQQDIGLVPSFESLKALDPCADLSIKVVSVDRFRDPGLKELLNSVINNSSSWLTTKDVIVQLANLVTNRMG